MHCYPSPCFCEGEEENESSTGFSQGRSDSICNSSCECCERLTAHKEVINKLISVIKEFIKVFLAGFRDASNVTGSVKAALKPPSDRSDGNGQI